MSGSHLFPKLVVVGATGWYGKTFVYEYAIAYGLKAACENLLLFASRSSTLCLKIAGSILKLPVFDLAEAPNCSLAAFDGLLWYSFILKNKLPVIGCQEYRRVNQSIAEHVFSCLNKNLHLHVTFFSSGDALDAASSCNFDLNPYAFLKNKYELELANYGPFVTLYPYATLGKFIVEQHLFAASSFLYQAILTGRIEIRSKFPVVRSYGSVHDFSKLLLRLYEIKDWQVQSLPSKIVPVTHTLDLFQLAHEVSASLGKSCPIISNFDPDSTPSVYTATDYSYGAQLSRFGVKSTDLRQQLIDMASGDAFQMSANNT